MAWFYGRWRPWESGLGSRRRIEVWPAEDLIVLYGIRCIWVNLYFERHFSLAPIIWCWISFWSLHSLQSNVYGSYVKRDGYPDIVAMPGQFNGVFFRVYGNNLGSLPGRFIRMQELESRDSLTAVPWMMYWKMSVFFSWMFEPDDNIMSEKAVADKNIAPQIYSEKLEPGHKRSFFTFC